MSLWDSAVSTDSSFFSIKVYNSCALLCAFMALGNLWKHDIQKNTILLGRSDNTEYLLSLILVQLLCWRHSHHMHSIASLDTNLLQVGQVWDSGLLGDVDSPLSRLAIFHLSLPIDDHLPTWFDKNTKKTNEAVTDILPLVVPLMRWIVPWYNSVFGFG